MNRRNSLIAIGAALSTNMLCLREATAQQAALQESDPEALEVEYKTDAKKVDPRKSPKFKAGRTCGNCSLFHGNGADSSGGCDLFYGKDVAAAGWCNVWEAKT